MLGAGDQPITGYTLEQCLGRGGFGEVWRARGPGGTPVVLKLISVANKYGWKEYAAARRMREIRHPHLLPIHGLWLVDGAGTPFDDAELDHLAGGHVPSSGTLVSPRSPSMLVIAMTLGEKSLQQLLEEHIEQGHRGIPVQELLGYMQDAARGIDYLNCPIHPSDDGVVALQHCDIKPQNIVLVGDSAVVCDFGLARVLGESRLTSVIPGSPAYVAPECISGKQPSQATDQYSLALTYYELRTGHLPFADESCAAVLAAHLRGDLDLSRLPPAERAVLQRALTLDPAERYPQSQDMVSDLRQAVEHASQEGGVPRPLRSASVSKQEAGPSRQRRPGHNTPRFAQRALQRTSLVCLAGLVIVAAGYVVGGLRRADGELRSAVTAGVSDQTESPHAITQISPAAKTPFSEGTPPVAPSIQPSPPISEPLTANASTTTELAPCDLAKLDPPPSASEGRRAIGQSDATSPPVELTPLAENAAPPVESQASPAAKATGIQLRQAFDKLSAQADGNSTEDSFGDDSVTTDAQLDTYPVKHLYDLGTHTSWPSSVVFAPHRNELLSGAWDSAARLWELHDRREKTRFLGHDSMVTGVAFAADGHSILTSSDDGTVRHWDVVSGQLLRHLTGHEGSVLGIAVSADGRYFASAGADRTVRLWSARTGEEVRRFEGHTEGVRSVAFTPDGCRLASGGDDFAVRVWNVESGALLSLCAAHDMSITSVAFAPDGKLVGSASWDGTSRLWDSHSGGVAHQLTGHSDSVTGIAFSPDGRWVVTGGEDKTIRFWDCRSGKEVVRVGSRGGEVYGVAVSPDGRLVATANENYTLTVWQVGF